MMCHDCVNGPSGRDFIKLTNRVDNAENFNRNQISKLNNVDGSLYDPHTSMIVQLDLNQFHFLDNNLNIRFLAVSLDNPNQHTCYAIKGHYNSTNLTHVVAVCNEK
jgi:hypothetical protein